VTAFLVILALFVATVLLWLSMRRHLGRIDVEDGGSRAAEGGDEGTRAEGTEGEGTRELGTRDEGNGGNGGTGAPASG